MITGWSVSRIDKLRLQFKLTKYYFNMEGMFAFPSIVWEEEGQQRFLTDVVAPLLYYYGYKKTTKRPRFLS